MSVALVVSVPGEDRHDVADLLPDRRELEHLLEVVGLPGAAPTDVVLDADEASVLAQVVDATLILALDEVEKETGKRVDRATAAEYSFFLAIPTMIGATTLALWKARHELGNAHLSLIAVGFAVSFVVALLVIHWFVGVVSRRGFVPFAWYRIGAGTVALVWLWALH